MPGIETSSAESEFSTIWEDWAPNPSMTSAPPESSVWAREVFSPTTVNTTSSTFGVSPQ
jgi:hypothetical protein